MNTWVRRECFNHFFNNVKCTYSITVNNESSSPFSFPMVTWRNLLKKI
ncbi:hypothetical protein JW813_12780 [Clostridium botulinum]|nr:hypothetical protein [Clostridium botulinum]NFR15834.1 hypothetical protein [Clostridium botulinum]NFR44814.1 hypothetical protein [Clostridium botulinum]NFS51298.1 hypothetical protein [Clostridium botulinum]UZP02588.1 hypothetical protein JW813_12780 [Clostridium botulinum]